MSFRRASSPVVMLVDSEPERRPVRSAPARPLSASTSTTTTTTTTTTTSSSIPVDDLLAHLSAAEAHLLLTEDDLKEEHMKEKTETKEEKKSTTKTAPPATATMKSLKEEVADTDPDARPPARPASTSSRRGVYTREEVAAHNTAESCWLIVGNDVYDVTPFLASHPAGPAPLLRRAGGDATRDFHFHSRTAQRSWSQYKIGVLEGSSSSMCLLM